MPLIDQLETTVDFNPRPPHGGRPVITGPVAPLWQFNPRLLTEGDPRYRAGGRRCGKFQSTPSSRRATCSPSIVVFPERDSIHALLTEGDD